MSLDEWIKLLWPAAVGLVITAIRVEVGQALTKQRLTTIERDAAKGATDAAEDIKALHARMLRHETAMQSVLSEIQRDIKTLLARHP